MKNLKMIFLSNSEEETIKIGEKISQEVIGKGDVVLFFGALGAGKTTLIRGICKGFKCDPSIVRSPSFTIVNEYNCLTKIYHVDLYRIVSLEDFESTGIYEILKNDENIVLMEWAENCPMALENSIKIYMEIVDFNKRRISIEKNGK